MQLTVQQRTVTGKRVKALRKEGLVPCVVYGNHLDGPVSLSIDKVQLVKTYRKAWRSTAIELHGDGVDELVLIQEIQLHPVSDHLMHVDFLAVRRDVKVTADIPLVLEGESPFEKSWEWSVQLLRNTVEVEALPMDLPKNIVYDISSIDHDGQVIFVKDLAVWDKVEIITDLEMAIINSAVFAEEVEEVVEETTEGEEGATEGEWGEAAAE